jgi:hypothetical protein
MPCQNTATDREHSLAISQHLAIAMLQHVHHWHNLRRLCEALLVLLRYKLPQFIHVDCRVPKCVPRQMVMAHTDLTEVSRMVFIKIYSERSQGALSPVIRVTMNTHTGDGADHRQDRDLQGVFGAFLHDHGRLKHVHDVCESSSDGSASSTDLKSQHLTVTRTLKRQSTAGIVPHDSRISTSTVHRTHREDLGRSREIKGG